MEHALPPLSLTILSLMHNPHDPWFRSVTTVTSSSSSSTTTYASASLPLLSLPYPLPSLMKALIATVVLVMIAMTIIGNALVFLAVLLVRKLKQPSNLLIVSLAIADFFVGLLVMPLALIDLVFTEWPLGRSMCKLWTTADLTLCTASIMSLCAISVDRYLVITRPLQYSVMRTTARMLIYVAVVWVIAAIVSLSSHVIATLLDIEKSEEGRLCQVIQHFAYQIYATIISFYGPTVIMLILYVQIWRAAKRIARKDHHQATYTHIGSDKNINGDADLIPHSGLSLEITKKEQHEHLRCPSAMLHAVKMPLDESLNATYDHPIGALSITRELSRPEVSSQPEPSNSKC